MPFYKSWIFWIALGIYIAGLILCGLGLYANIVQVIQGAAFATFAWHTLQRIEALHRKHDQSKENVYENPTK